MMAQRNRRNNNHKTITTPKHKRLGKGTDPGVFSLQPLFPSLSCFLSPFCFISKLFFLWFHNYSLLCAVDYSVFCKDLWLIKQFLHLTHSDSSALCDKWRAFLLCELDDLQKTETDFTLQSLPEVRFCTTEHGNKFSFQVRCQVFLWNLLHKHFTERLSVNDLCAEMYLVFNWRAEKADFD